MSTLRISDAPLLPDVDGTEKIPTGGRGDYTISVDQIKDHIFQDVGKELVGLGNVDNTSDLDKPVSTAQQAALNLKADKTYVDTNLDLKADKTNVYTRSETSLALSKKADLVNGIIPENQIPSSFNDVLEFTTANLPLIGESGKIYVTTDNNKTWRWAVNKYVEVSGWNPDSVSKVVTLPTYYTVAAGVDPVTGVADGAYFNVLSEDDDTVAIEYHNVGGVPTPSGKSYPSSGYVQEIAEYTPIPFDENKVYDIGRSVTLDNGDIVKSTINGNTTNPNVDMTGWTNPQAEQNFFNESTGLVVKLKTSNTWQQNRDIIQAANDTLYASSKGGKIQLPIGNFKLKGVVLDSDITVVGNNTWLEHPDGFDVDMFATRTFSTSGGIVKDSYTLTVSDATGFKVGSLVGIECAGGLNIYQSTTLVNAVDASQTTGFQFADKKGFQSYSVGHGLLIIDNEIISYSSMDANGVLGGVVRGLLGTTAAAHSAGAQIGISSRHVTEIINVSGNTITLLNKAKFTVAGANVLCGGQRTKVLDINVKGARQNNVSGHRWSPFRMTLHKFAEANYYVEDSENGVYLQNSCENKVDIRAKDVSKTGTGKIGAAIWCYQGSHNNELNLKIVGDCWCGVVVDDRSNIATEWIDGCSGNHGTIVGNFNNYDTVTPLNTTLLNITACEGNNFTIKAYNIYAPTFVADDAQGISAVGAFRKAEGNEIDVYADTCVNPVSAANVKNNIFKVVSKNAANPKPLIGNGNLLAISNYQSTNGMGFKLVDGTYDSPAYGFLNQAATGMSLDSIGRLSFYKAGVPMLTISDNDMIFRDGKGINTGSTSGTKFGLDPSQKLAFYGTAPRTKPTGTPFAATDAATTQALVNSLRASLISLGLIE